MTQTEQVIEVMRANGGYATFGKLNQLIDFSSWATKTPQASVRRIVQQSNAFFRIQSGLWALREYQNEVLSKFNITRNDKDSEEIFTHGYYQGVLVEIGNLKKYTTYVPAQDQKRKFLEQSLGEISKTIVIPEFTYPQLVDRAKTVDVIWFNERELPNSFFEVEHSTDIQNSVAKYCDLQDFNSNFYIIAPEHRHSQFEKVMERTIFKDIKNKVKFVNYETIVSQYEKMSALAILPHTI
ncbi:MAG: hypothetical protein MJZ59_03705 [Paludibacteraceae bacterium]|nr:hypothetical protein [Paludibacteraceae bacterium]